MKLDVKNIREKIKQTEDVVSIIQDDSLKRIAFEILLSILLHEEYKYTPVLEKESVTKSKLKKKTSGIRKSEKKKKSQIKELKNSELNFDDKILKELKTYYEEKSPSGEEKTVFTLACFADEKLNKSSFHAGDIDYIYKNLVSLKPKIKPPALDQAKIKRALSFLTAPSRKRMWLRAIDDSNFEISPHGRLTYES